MPQQNQQVQYNAKRQILNKYGGAEYLDGKDGLASAATMIVDTKNDRSNSNNSNNNNHPDVAIAAAMRATPNMAVDDDVPSDRQLRFGVSTQVEEFTRDGRLITSTKLEKNKKRTALESKYQENVYQNGHTTVWGSYFHLGAFTWGYNDDHSLMKNSYCTGINGRYANDEANTMQYGTGQVGSATLAQVRQMLPPKNKSSTNNNAQMMNRSSLYGAPDPSIPLNEQKVQAALHKRKESSHVPPLDNNPITGAASTTGVTTTTGKRIKGSRYNSNRAEEEMTPEMIEAYRIQKVNTTNDPMAHLTSSSTTNHSDDILLEYK
jgi:pre-mRNA-processing factor SLU7